MEKKEKEVEEENIREVIVEKKAGFNLIEVVVIIVIALLFGVFIGSAITYARSDAKSVMSEVPSELKELVSTYEDLVENYYEEVDETALLDAGIRGMINYLDDPYASFMDVVETESFNEQVEGHYVGIGVEIMQTLTGANISKIFENGPSEKAGLKVGDTIISVDGESVEGLSLSEISSKVKGEENTKVKIGYRRGEETGEVEVTRQDIDIISVTGKVFSENDQKVGYLKVDIFASNTTEQFETELKALEKQEIDSLIIDVRDNPGGHLTQVSEILSLFLDKSQVLYQLETKGETEKIYSLTKEKRDYPIVVLINQSSASASEILASCLKESYGASIVGVNSYGKGTVQEAYSLQSGATIKYTTQKWLTPNGNWINEKGVEPTVVVEQSDAYYENATEANDLQLQKAIEEALKK